MTFLEKNTTKLRTIKEIETILSENNIGINDFEEIVSQIRTDYKNNPLDSKNIKRKYIVYNFTYITIIIVFLLIVFLEFFQKSTPKSARKEEKLIPYIVFIIAQYFRKHNM